MTARRRGRRVTPLGGDTYEIVEERGERAVRCRACRTVVPLPRWLLHVCDSTAGGGEVASIFPGLKP